MSFYVKTSIPGSVAYHTGEFDRSLPPDPYITENLSEAVSWEDRAGAESWAEQFGGEVVEIQSNPILTDIPKNEERMAAKSALNKIADCAIYSGDSVELTREEILALLNQKIIDLDVYRGMME